MRMERKSANDHELRFKILGGVNEKKKKKKTWIKILDFIIETVIELDLEFSIWYQIGAEHGGRRGREWRHKGQGSKPYILTLYNSLVKPEELIDYGLLFMGL